MAVTEAVFIRRVLEELSVLGTGQSVDNDDADKVRIRLSSAFADLSARGVVTVADITQADDALIDPLIAIIARRCCKAFSIGGSELAEHIALAEEAERTIRAMNSSVDGEVNEPGAYF